MSAAVIPGLITLTCVVPLAAIGIASARRTGFHPRTRAPLLWLLATLFTILISPTGQYRALDGIAIPVAVLVVSAWPAGSPGLRTRGFAVLGLAVALVPFGCFAVGAFGHLRGGAVTAYSELEPSDVRAARLAADGARGAPVLTLAPLGTAVPALTGAVSWLGHPIWTSDYIERKTQATNLFSGAMDAVHARRFVHSTGAGAVVEPCGSSARLTPALEPLGFRTTRVGCSVVYTRVR